MVHDFGVIQQPAQMRLQYDPMLSDISFQIRAGMLGRIQEDVASYIFALSTSPLMIIGSETLKEGAFVFALPTAGCMLRRRCLSKLLATDDTISFFNDDGAPVLRLTAHRIAP